MHIYLDADHRGYELINDIAKRMNTFEVINLSGKLNPKDDFPKVAEKLIKKFLADPITKKIGILACGSGQGMVMAANKFKGIRAALCLDVKSAELARRDDNANILVLAADLTGEYKIYDIIEAFVETKFDASVRRVRRVKELNEL